MKIKETAADATTHDAWLEYVEQAIAIADTIRANLAVLREAVGEYGYLFSDRQELVTKDKETVELIARQRIDEHKRAEHERLEAERARIRAEEEREVRMALLEADVALPVVKDFIQAVKTKARMEKAAIVKREQDEQAKAFDALNSPEERAKHSDTPPAQTVTASIPGARPSEREIVEALAHAFSVSNDLALAWILDFFHRRRARRAG